MATALAAGALLCGWAAPASAQPGIGKPTITRISPVPNVTVAVLPQQTALDDLAKVPGLSLGAMSTGIGDVPAEQTYLDISQGNRIDDALYGQALPPLPSFWARIPNWGEIVRRADRAPADIAPGLLASSLLDRGIRSRAVPAAESAALIAARRDGVVGVDIGGSVSVISEGIGLVRKQETVLGRDDLLIALAMPGGECTVPIGIAGRGFDGNLTSDSTRTDGYVLSTDIAPTILRRLGLAVPDAMDGEPITTEGSVDPVAIEDRVDRMGAVSERREGVVVGCLVAWIAVSLAIALPVPRLRRLSLAWLALAFAYMPLMLLAGAAIEPGALAEGLLIGLGAGALAALTVAVIGGWWALSIACAITVIAYAIDVVTGSGLTELSLLGPNPIFGVRFYGIGNELEALIAVMVPVGVGAGLSAGIGWGRAVSRSAAIIAFLAAGAVSAIVFAAGRFGADVGAAITLAVGAAVAAASLPSMGNFEAFAHSRPQNPSRSGLGVPRRRLALALAAAPLIAFAALALIDLVSGGNSHLTRSVLDAGGAGDLADVAQRRLTLSAHDFAQAAENPLFWVVVAGIGAALAGRRRIDAWLEPVPLARAGLIGACAAVAVGMLVNDSGATFLVLGSLALGASLAFAWAQAGGDPQ
jgi:hypothetical protein